MWTCVYYFWTQKFYFTNFFSIEQKNSSIKKNFRIIKDFRFIGPTQKMCCFFFSLSLKNIELSFSAVIDESKLFQASFIWVIFILKSGYHYKILPGVIRRIINERCSKWCLQIKARSFINLDVCEFFARTLNAEVFYIKGCASFRVESCPTNLSVRKDEPQFMSMSTL